MIEDVIVKVKEAEAQADEIVANAKREAASLRRQAEDAAVKAREEAILKADTDRREAQRIADANTAALDESFDRTTSGEAVAEDKKRAAIDAVISLALQ